MGLLFYLYKNIFKPMQWGPLLLLIPFGFNISTLFMGQSVIWLPMVAPYLDTYFNARYGILMLPAAAFFVGYLASRHIVWSGVMVAAIVIQFVLFFYPKQLPLFGREIGIITRQDTVSSINTQTIKASDYLHNNYDSGLILISAASVDSFIFRAQIPLKNFITEGSGRYWKESLDNPTKHATWLVFFKDHTDRVGKKVGLWPHLRENFSLQYEDQTFQIWKKTSK
jgi:hypothetical protein